ncbi:putative ankyrin repeat protein RF_0381 [Argiope bruennichi]|uniref:Putative ankyrin repeat protein-like protein n=1 Tax=Argiope bruennichi TaxID=94029 RepID=A0A8T0EKK6_ARGBR|nr:putative ankyrin repeat protein RF_0381 [Argiope bruennichi]XP_055949491.1 putative ankyrin repeat protein RF_0381 [Argiope bruennichi]KAF8774427.1 putative ankyrin repeat protein-like protein [Argiope bruennichi]
MEKKHWIICTEFLKAIEENNCNRVNRILDTGFDIDTDLKVQRTAISICASNGWYEMAHLLMTRGCSLSLKNNKGETPLHLAVLRSDYDLVKLLLENRADVTSVDHMKRTVLHCACEMGCFKVATLVAKYSSPTIINMKDNSSKTPLLYACHYGCTDLIGCLLTQGAEINITDSRGNSPLIYAIENQKCSTEMINLLLDAGADINHCNDANETALLKACQVFSKCSSYNSGSKYRDNPKYREILLLLIERGSDVNARNRLCESVLHLSVIFQDEFLIRTLLNKGADVNATTCMGIVPLVYACKKGPHQVISLLINAGARFNFGYYARYVGRTWPLPQDECNNPCGKFISLILNLLDKLSSRPPTLKNLCRISIRKNLSKHILNSVPSLPLPPSLKKFLLFLE